MKKITFTVTNDLVFDQRMQRICSTLSDEGYDVLLIGRLLKSSPNLLNEKFQQKRLPCFFQTGIWMYIEFNIRLMFFLLFTSSDCYAAIDLDTILPNYFVSAIKGKKRVYDAHELFTEQKEIITRPLIHKIWLSVERFSVPRFRYGYTVNDFIKQELNHRYGVNYEVIRNLPKFNDTPIGNKIKPPFIIYQGAVNEGRSFETLIPAMAQVNAKLVICGTGNFFNKMKNLVKHYHLENKIEIKGMLTPAELQRLTPQASVAVTLFENTGLNQYQSLANRFFDYIMAGVPQVCVNYPQYKAVNDQFHVAHLIDNTKEQTISGALNNLLADTVYHEKLVRNCIAARTTLNWDTEKGRLVVFFNKFINEIE